MVFTADQSLRFGVPLVYTTPSPWGQVVRDTKMPTPKEGFRSGGLKSNPAGALGFGWALVLRTLILLFA
jgi:hypothetical protein